MIKLLFYILFLFPISLFSQNLDIRILRSINNPQNLKSDNFFRLVSNTEPYIIGTVPVVMATVGFIKHDNTILRKSCVVAGTIILDIGITSILKYSINHNRPFTTYTDIINKSKKPCLDPSFPSGHTSTAFATATSLSLSYPKWYIIVPSYTWASTVAYSRMELGVHYPSDVFIGALIGTGCAYITHIVNNKLNIK